MQFDTHSMKAYFNDLERQVKPQLKDYKPRQDTLTPALRVISLVGVFLAAGLFLPLPW